MKSLLILPFLLVKSLSGPVNDHSNSIFLRNSSPVTIKACFIGTSQYDSLDPNLIGNKLISMAQDAYTVLTDAGVDMNADDFSNIDPAKLDIVLKKAKYLHVEYNENKLCGLKVSKNIKTGNFIAEYNSFPKSECAANSKFNIICNNPENNNCNMAIKCCDPKTKCEMNAFLLKTVATNSFKPLFNKNGDVCASDPTDRESCFTLASMIKEENNSQQQAGGQLNFLLQMLYVIIAPYVLLQ